LLSSTVLDRTSVILVFTFQVNVVASQLGNAFKLNLYEKAKSHDDHDYQLNSRNAGNERKKDKLIEHTRGVLPTSCNRVDGEEEACIYLFEF